MEIMISSLVDMGPERPHARQPKPINLEHQASLGELVTPKVLTMSNQHPSMTDLQCSETPSEYLVSVESRPVHLFHEASPTASEMTQSQCLA